MCSKTLWSVLHTSMSVLELVCIVGCECRIWGMPELGVKSVDCRNRINLGSAQVPAPCLQYRYELKDENTYSIIS